MFQQNKIVKSASILIGTILIGKYLKHITITFCLIIVLITKTGFALENNLATNRILENTQNVAELDELDELEKENATIKDYGIRGHIFPIEEESMLEVIKAKLAKAEEEGALQELQDQFREKVKKKILRPLSVAGISRTTKNKSWLYDPIYIQENDIKDQQGRIIVQAGTSVNPLDTISWGEPLIFIDGDDSEQLLWADKRKGKITLVKGGPIKISKQLNREIFFDQGGILTKRFSIMAVPAVIEQEGRKLRISEIKI